jgi:hypothetical protein
MAQVTPDDGARITTIDEFRALVFPNEVPELLLRGDVTAAIRSQVPDDLEARLAQVIQTTVTQAFEGTRIQR